jgi:PAS domain S-box-containing protein
MTEWTSRIQKFVNGIAASVAVVGHDNTGALVVCACDEIFFEMTSGRPPGARCFPMPFDTLVPSYARREFRDRIQECFNSGIAQELEQAYDLKSGTHWWRLSLQPLRLKDGDTAILEILVTGLDVIRKMELTLELEVSTSRFRSVVDAAYDGIITIDQQHNITLLNRAAELLFGYSQSEMIGQPLSILIPHRFRRKHGEHIQHFSRSPVNSRQMDERNRIYGLHRDGSLASPETRRPSPL